MGINIRKEVDNYASVAFSLLGVLFGMGIMVFIFGNLGPETGGLTPNTLAYNISQNVTIDSLDAVQTYSSSSDSQFTTVSIAVVLVLLLSVFFLFWRAFKGSKSGGRSNRMSDASQFG